MEKKQIAKTLQITRIAMFLKATDEESRIKVCYILSDTIFILKLCLTWD